MQGRSFPGLRELLGPGRRGDVAVAGLRLRGELAAEAEPLGPDAAVPVGLVGVAGGDAAGGGAQDGDGRQGG